MNEEQNRKQKLLRYLVFALVGIVFIVLSGVTIFDYLENKNPSQKTVTTEAHLPLDGIDPKEIWVDQIRNENHLILSSVYQ